MTDQKQMEEYENTETETETTKAGAGSRMSSPPSTDSFESDAISLDIEQTNYCYQLEAVLGYFARKNYQAADQEPLVQIMVDKSIELMEKDYDVFLVNNEGGTLCPTYPKTLVIPIREKGCDSGDAINTDNLKGLMSTACFARCRKRFVAPVILYKQKYIARSATISLDKEVWMRKTEAYLTATMPDNDQVDAIVEANMPPPELRSSRYETVERGRVADIQLLKLLNIGNIVDLMVERQKSKYYFIVSSSEKAENKSSDFYRDFNIIQMPFPGCEFFSEFYKNNYNARGLFYQWPSSQCNAHIKLPDFATNFSINWTSYRDWDIVTLKQNYIKFILNYFDHNDSGILIHCISGWDRTPLFISMLRISLWADGLIHRSLNEIEILYLTIAYDWALFGHNFNDRLKKNEDILLFCFMVTKYFVSDEFSLQPEHADETGGTSQRTSKSSSPELPGASEILSEPQHDSNDSDQSLPNSSFAGMEDRDLPLKKRKLSDSEDLKGWQFVTQSGSSVSSTIDDLDFNLDLDKVSKEPPEIGRARRLKKLRIIFFKLYFKVIDKVDVASNDNDA